MSIVLRRNPLREMHQHCFVMGTTGCGKTHLILDRWFWAAPPGWSHFSRGSSITEKVIFIDTNMNLQEPEYEQMFRTYSRAFHNDVYVAHTPSEFEKAYQEGYNYLVYSPPALIDHDQFRTEVEGICDMIVGVQSEKPVSMRKPILILFDEIADLVHGIQPNAVTRVFTKGRVLRITGVGISQRMAMCPKSIVSQCDIKIVFCLNEEEYACIKRQYNMAVPYEIQHSLDEKYCWYYRIPSKPWIRGYQKKKNQYNTDKVKLTPKVI